MELTDVVLQYLNDLAECLFSFGIIYITRKLALITSNPHDCPAPHALYSAAYPSPYAAGAFVTPVALTNNQKIQIGKNYSYNMIYTAIYFGNQPTSGASAPNALHDDYC